eukprot:12924043-Prorocentrum_lima.AAC.1
MCSALFTDFRISLTAQTTLNMSMSVNSSSVGCTCTRFSAPPRPPVAVADPRLPVAVADASLPVAVADPRLP